MSSAVQQAGSLMQAEIAEQPAVVERILAVGEPEVERIAALVTVSAPRAVLLAARGSSDHAALYAKYLVEVLLGLPAGLISPSTSTVYGARSMEAGTVNPRCGVAPTDAGRHRWPSVPMIHCSRVVLLLRRGPPMVPGVDYTLIALGVAVVLVAVTSSAGRRETERRQMRRLALVERKLDALLDHLGVEVPQPHLERVEELLGRGRTIEAIKAYREATGTDLREAKEAVDRLGGRG
jgi:hypothetical protein